MSSLTNDFKGLMEKVEAGREFGHASFEPIYYLIFAPSQILDVKCELPAWIATLKNNGWDVSVFSMTQAIQELFDSMPPFIKKTWTAQDAKSPLDWEKTNKSLAEAVNKKGALQSQLEKKLKELEEDSKAILLITDTEALHPYIRIGSIESQLYGKFKVPTIILYPGTSTGKTQLKFLGFYPEDGNYRSEHHGG